MPMIYIIRGVSGSGKSKLGENMAYHIKAKWFENDHFLIDEFGEYVWTPERAYHAAEACYAEVRRTMIHGDDIVVSNTSCSERTLQKYIQLAKEFNYMFTVMTIENRNNTDTVHNVPKTSLLSQTKQLSNSLNMHMVSQMRRYGERSGNKRRKVLLEEGTKFRPKCWYLVSVQFSSTNPEQKALLYTGFLQDEQTPGSYNLVTSPSWGEQHTFRDLYSCKIIQDLGRLTE